MLLAQTSSFQHNLLREPVHCRDNKYFLNCLHDNDDDSSQHFLRTCHVSKLISVFYLEFVVSHWRRQWHPTPVLLPGKSHGWRSLVGCSPWGREELDTTERLHFHISLSCTGEGNGTPLQRSCLENPRDGEPGGLPSMGSHRVGHD